MLPTAQACPECGGLMKLTQHGGLHEYSCHTGHPFGLKTMIARRPTGWSARSARRCRSSRS